MTEVIIESTGYKQNVAVSETGGLSSYEPVMDAVVVQWVENEDGLAPVVSVMLKNPSNRDLYEAKAREIMRLLKP